MTARSTETDTRTATQTEVAAETDTGFTPFELAVIDVLAGLAPGDVTTYGEVAAEAGYPGRARAVGRFLANYGSDHPWWRVVTAGGRLVPGHEQEQARRLRAEGVRVVNGHVAPA